MKNVLAKSTRLPILVVLFGMLVCLPLFSKAHASVTAITIVNNSNREIRHVYLSSVDQDNWGPDQLNNSVIRAGGGSTTLNIACNGAVKVIAEDQNGCFLYHNLTCDERVTWTIGNDVEPDCGH